MLPYCCICLGAKQNWSLCERPRVFRASPHWVWNRAYQRLKLKGNMHTLPLPPVKVNLSSWCCLPVSSFLCKCHLGFLLLRRFIALKLINICQYKLPGEQPWAKAQQQAFPPRRRGHLRSKLWTPWQLGRWESSIPQWNHQDLQSLVSVLSRAFHPQACLLGRPLPFVGCIQPADLGKAVQREWLTAQPLTLWFSALAELHNHLEAF